MYELYTKKNVARSFNSPSIREIWFPIPPSMSNDEQNAGVHEICTCGALDGAKECTCEFPDYVSQEEASETPNPLKRSMAVIDVLSEEDIRQEDSQGWLTWENGNYLWQYIN